MTEVDQKQHQQFIQQQHYSLLNGTCIDCGIPMLNYQNLDTDENWKPEEGWLCYTPPDKVDPAFWQCPSCYDKICPKTCSTTSPEVKETCNGSCNAQGTA